MMNESTISSVAGKRNYPVGFLGLRVNYQGQMSRVHPYTRAWLLIAPEPLPF